MEFEGTERPGIRASAAAGLIGLVAMVLVGCKPAPPAGNVSPAVADGVNVPAIEATMTPDSRYVAFRSSVALTGGETDVHNVYRFDRVEGTTTLVSVGSAGTAPGGPLPPVPRPADLSDDGRYVVWATLASHVADDSGAHYDAYLRDVVAGQTIRISAPAVGEADANSFNPKISPDGRYVAFTSEATNLLPGETVADDGNADVYRWDRLTGDMTRVTVGRTIGGDPVDPNGDSGARQVFDDGSVVLESRATNLDPTVEVEGPAALAGYLANPDGTVEVLTAFPNGDLLQTSVFALSGDKRWLVVNDRPDARWGISGLTNGSLIVIDRTTGIASAGPLGSDGKVATSVYSPHVSADGRFVAFETAFASLPGATGDRHAYVWDRTSGVTRRVDRYADGSTGVVTNEVRGISDDGKTALYFVGNFPKVFSTASNGGSFTVIAPTHVP